MPWIIKCWIPIEEENPHAYPTKDLAEKDIESMEVMQPENIYEAEEVVDNDKKQ